MTSNRVSRCLGVAAVAALLILGGGFGSEGATGAGDRPMGNSVAECRGETCRDAPNWGCSHGSHVHWDYCSVAYCGI